MKINTICDSFLSVFRPIGLLCDRRIIINGILFELQSSASEAAHDGGSMVASAVAGAADNNGSSAAVAVGSKRKRVQNNRYEDFGYIDFIED